MASSIQLPAVVTETVDKAVAAFDKLNTPQKVAVGVAGGLTSLVLLNKLLSATAGYKRKPSSLEL